MPLISAQIIKGRPPELRAAFMRELAEAAVRTLGVREESVRVILTEIEPEHWGIGLRNKAEIDGERK
ncbi:hypothetical protein ASD39_20790 [Sphingomonas sp. Root50]|nr:hypothetical protein ASD17_16895 [Sphingomonas sp. Root1294]KQY70358.1 hypothetical protein ASD39_20790 [Sphingomonas sp. Root50]KRB92154.1 hypothetical protein ASE22_09520 [Sphingomonas sp. Root720]